MKRLTQNEFDQSTMEAMMERYRAELLRYQRATPPGRPTLEQNLQIADTDPPEQDIWQQPAVFASEQPKAEAMPEIPPVFDEPTELPQPEPVFEQPPVLDITSPIAEINSSCAEFKKCIGAYGSFVPYPHANSCCKAEIFRYAAISAVNLLRA